MTADMASFQFDLPIMGEAVWQLVAGGQPVIPDNIASRILALSERHNDL